MFKAVIVAQQSPQIRRLPPRTGAPSKLGADRLAFGFVQVDDLPLYEQDLQADLPTNIGPDQVGDCGGGGLVCS
jgi:hypothetical protein